MSFRKDVVVTCKTGSGGTWKLTPTMVMGWPIGIMGTWLWWTAAAPLVMSVHGSGQW